MLEPIRFIHVGRSVPFILFLKKTTYGTSVTVLYNEPNNLLACQWAIAKHMVDTTRSHPSFLFTTTSVFKAHES